MKRKDNPVFIFGVLTVAIFLVIGVWISFPGCNKAMGAVPVVIQSKAAHDDLPNFLVLSDIHLHSSLIQDDITPTGAADTGHDLWDTTQNKLRAVLAGSAGFSAPKFIIVLGDLPWHAKADIKEELKSAHENSGMVLHDLRTLAENAHIPLIYVDGNNDPWDGDYHPFSTKIFEKDALCQTCWPLIHPLVDGNEQATIIDDSKLNLGCYSVYPLGKKGKLRVIALNSGIFSHKYTDTEHQTADVTTVIKWLGVQLEQATAQNEFVLMAMHMPPGVDGFKKKDYWRKTVTSDGTEVQNAFLDLVDKYHAHIIGMLSSHTHMDGLRKLYNRNGKMIAVDISVPGITPGHGNNPGFKLISYKRGNFELYNFATLYEGFFPAKKVVSWGNQSFDFKAEFGCPKGTSIRSCLESLNIETLQNAVQSIYKVKNGAGNADEVNAAIDVRYE